MEKVLVFMEIFLFSLNVLKRFRWCEFAELGKCCRLDAWTMHLWFVYSGYSNNDLVDLPLLEEQGTRYAVCIGDRDLLFRDPGLILGF
jgi:hypothetical protein